MTSQTLLHFLPCLSPSLPQCDEPKAGAWGLSLCPLALLPSGPNQGLCLTKEKDCVLLHCMAFFCRLLGQGLSWPSPALPAHCYYPTSSGPSYLCLATGSTSSGVSLCQIQLLEGPFFFNWMGHLLPYREQSGRVCVWKEDGSFRA